VRISGKGAFDADEFFADLEEPKQLHLFGKERLRTLVLISAVQGTWDYVEINPAERMVLHKRNCFVVRPNLAGLPKVSLIHRAVRRNITGKGAEDPGGSTMPTALSTFRIVVPSLALLTAGSAVLFVGITHVRPGVQALAPTQADATVGAAPLDVPRRSLDTEDGFTPVFDIARIEPSGDAVIAGRAAPGASVELLRDGKFHDRAVADRTGQFVMVPPQLPPGDYELTLRSTQPGGKRATSKQSVAVALRPILKDPTAVGSTTPAKASVALKSVAHPAAGRNVGSVRAGSR
jgi:hypothetical protein